MRARDQPLNRSGDCRPFCVFLQIPFQFGNLAAEPCQNFSLQPFDIAAGFERNHGFTFRVQRYLVTGKGVLMMVAGNEVQQPALVARLQGFSAEVETSDRVLEGLQVKT